jgi:hypothetical protein
VGVYEQAAQQLQRLYQDRLTAWGSSETADENNVTSLKRDVMYLDNVPCKLVGKDIPTPGEPMPTYTKVYTVHTAPGVLLQTGSKIEIVHLGQTYAGDAGESHPYNTHVETSVTVKAVS